MQGRSTLRANWPSGDGDDHAAQGCARGRLRVSNRPMRPTRTHASRSVLDCHCDLPARGIDTRVVRDQRARAFGSLARVVSDDERHRLPCRPNPLVYRLIRVDKHRNVVRREKVRGCDKGSSTGSTCRRLPEMLLSELRRAYGQIRIFVFTQPPLVAPRRSPARDLSG